MMSGWLENKDKKTVLSPGNRAMPQLFFSIFLAGE